MNKKILIVVDNVPGGWCWTSTSQAMAYALPEYDFDLMPQKEFKEILKKDHTYFFKYDIVYFRGYSNIFLDEKDMDKFHVPYISTLATGGVNLDRRIAEMKTTAIRAKAIIVQNMEAWHKARMALYNNVHIIPNGVDTGLFFPSKEDPGRIIGCAANTRLARGKLKGADLLAGVCEDLDMRYDEASLLKKRTHEEMAKWYRTLRYYVQPSEAEGCSNSVMEAMASGLPCFICEGVGYHGEVCKCGIENGDGNVVFVKRNKTDIIKKISFLENNPGVYDRIKINARKFALQHRWSAMAHKYRTMFDSAFANQLQSATGDGSGIQVIISTEEYRKLKRINEGLLNTQQPAKLPNSNTEEL